MSFVRTVVACLAMVFACTQALAANLVVNGGFETGTLAGWSTTPAGAGSLFGVTSPPAHTGTYSAYFGATSGNTDSIHQDIPTSAGTRYTVSFWLYNSVAGGDYISVSWGQTGIYGANPVNIPANIWTKITLNARSESATTELRFSLFDAPGFVYIDDVSVESDNLLANPSFETGDFTGWTTHPASQGSFFGVTGSGGAHSGQYSAGFAAVTFFISDLIGQTVPTVPGHTYLLRFWYLDNYRGGDSLRVYWEGNLVYNASPVETTPYGEWAEVTLALVANGSTSELRLGGYDDPGHFLIDDVYLAPIDNPTCIHEGDADRNGVVEFADITAVLRNWGAMCMP